MARYYALNCDICKEIKLMRLVGYVESADLQKVECEACGTAHTKAPAPVPKKKTTWPYYHAGLGQTFESESHEKKYAAEHKLEKV